MLNGSLPPYWRRVDGVSKGGMGNELLFKMSAVDDNNNTRMATICHSKGGEKNAKRLLFSMDGMC